MASLSIFLARKPTGHVVCFSQISLFERAEISLDFYFLFLDVVSR